MVDVSAKPDTVREARARVTLRLRPATLRAIRRGEVVKGDVLGVARLAGIMAAKRTAELIPLCHPLRLTGIDVRFTLDRARSAVHVETAVRTVDKTGVEMEALTAAAGAGLAIYDMVKAIDRGMRLTNLCLVEKSGGRSGHWVRPMKTALIHSDAYKRFDYGPEHPLRMERLGLTFGLMDAYGLTRLPGTEVLRAGARAGGGHPRVPHRGVPRRAPRGAATARRCPRPIATASAPATIRSGPGSTRPRRSRAAARSSRPSWWRGATSSGPSPSPGGSITRCRRARPDSAT